MISDGLFTANYIVAKYDFNVHDTYQIRDQIREFDGILHYGYWSYARSNLLCFGGWYRFNDLAKTCHGITIYPHVIRVGGTKEDPYLTLENTAYNIGLLRSYAVQ